MISEIVKTPERVRNMLTSTAIGGSIEESLIEKSGKQ